jgi:alpha-galactosidase
MLKRVLSVFVLILGAALFSNAVITSQSGPASRAVPTSVQAPPNEAAQLSLDGGRVQLRYHNTVVFDGRVTNPSALRAIRPGVSRTGDRVDQVVAFSGSSSEPIELSGTVTASSEAFACEADRPLRGRPIVRHVSGTGSNLLDHAVYDRYFDWVLSVDDQPRTRTRVTPVEPPSGAAAHSRAFSLEARGGEIVLRFRPRFYQQHRGLQYFEPWTYRPWPEPIVGWCSWFAFYDKVTEQDVKRTADVMSEVLLPYGYHYLQVDDGYQRGTGLPELWLKANEKFPSGLPALARYIREKGLKPGIWTNAAFNQTDFAERHKSWFVLGPDGQPARGNWIGHVVDATAPGALDALVRPIYKDLRAQGWDYFKLDALRHLRYEGYNTFRAHFEGHPAGPTEALRDYVASVREEIGRDAFLLACWGIRPELVGLVDGCRIGTDGFSYAGLAQYNSFNNVVWRNDPDHIELSDTEAWRSAMVTSLTGSMFLLTDKPERYRTAMADPARRAAPVLVTTPGQLYDVDPSRSSQLWRVDGEVSGRDPKPFDASLTPSVFLYQLDIHRPFGSWTVLGRTGGSFDAIAFEDLGLDPGKRYLVFEFWQRKLLGAFDRQFAPGLLPTPFNSQVFIVREQRPQPQFLASSRHITGGGYDLESLEWANGVMAGRSLAVAGEPYEIYVTEPGGWTLQGFECDGGSPLAVERGAGWAKGGCTPEAGGTLAWRARFRPGVPPPAPRLPLQ